MIYKKEGETPRPKKRVGRIVLAVLLALVLLAAGVFALWFFALRDTGPTGPAPTPTLATGHTDALWLEATNGAADEEALREYYAAAVDYAAQNGFNTIVYNAKPGLGVWYRDSVFPLAADAAEMGSLFHRVDPLGLLLAETQPAGLEVWVQVSAYNGSGYEAGYSGAVAKLAKAQGAPTRFEPTDSEYAALLAQSLAELPHRYAVAGVVIADADSAAGEAAFASLLEDVRQSWAQRGCQARLFALADAGETAPTAYTALRAGGTLDGLLVQMYGADALAETTALWAQDGATLFWPRGAEAQHTLLYAAYQPSYAGAILNSWPKPGVDDAGIPALRIAATPAEGTLPAGFAVPQSLGITNPAEGATLYTEQLYIMGTSDPAQPLYLGEEEIARRTQNGIFGVLVSLEMGQNHFTFTQGGESAGLTVTRAAPAGGGGGAAATYTTETLAAGSAVRVSQQFTSALREWSDSSTINETFYEGAIAAAHTVVLRNGEPHAYQITGGDWLLASACEATTTGGFALGGIAATPAEDGEWLAFTGAGTPAAYVSFDAAQNSLALTLLGSTAAEAEGFTSQFVQATSVEQTDAGAVVTLQLSPIWGYSLEYTDGGVRLYLKRVPHQTGSATRPLEGLVIMLDPGHGDDDYGASAGIIGQHLETGPYEKDLNLAAAQATAYRLRQLGATVIMTRDDDSFTTIYERLAFQNQTKPDLFISFHRNSLEMTRDLGEVGGVEVFYYHPYASPPSSALAENITTQISEATGRSNRGAKWSTYVVTRTTVCPSVLVEFGFMSNPGEFESMLTAEDILIEADAVVAAILATIPS